MSSDLGSRLLSDLVTLRTYSETLPNGSKETPAENITRVKNMHIKKFPHLSKEINEAFQGVYNKQVVPSMRSMQFAGYAIERSNQRIYNCCYVPLEDFKDIADLCWISMNGTGVGYSVRSVHTNKLPKISEGFRENFEISDDKEGWADSILRLLFNPLCTFDYYLIRQYGEKLSTGGTASGPGALITAHENIRKILLNAVGRNLRPIEVHDIACHIGDAVVCGGVRRTALISLFDCTDEEMLTCKYGEWWVDNGQRARANNSAVIYRDDPMFDMHLTTVMLRCFASNSGEPGVFLTSDENFGTNPCCEISLRSRTVCNLSEVNAALCKTEDEFLKAIECATIIGTLQASYTDFKYIKEEWKVNCDEDRLLGVSITGQAQAQHILTPEILQKAALVSLEVNEKWAKLIGINKAARIGCTKPSGSTSAYLGTTSGIHAAHSEYTLRRVRIEADNPISSHLIGKFGISNPMTYGIIEQDAHDSAKVIVSVPIHYKNAVFRRNETSIELMERAKNIYNNWIAPTHRTGSNTHNVSLTVSYKEEEKSDIISWMLSNKNSFSGISFLPFSNSSYTQMPFEEITETQFRTISNQLANVRVDLFSVDFTNTEDTRKGQSACAGGACELEI